MWIDPSDPDRLVIGDDGGIDISFDRGRELQPVAEPPDRPVLRGELRLRGAVQHLRRRAGQRGLVRAEPAPLGRRQQRLLVHVQWWRRLLHRPGSGPIRTSSTASRRTAALGASTSRPGRASSSASPGGRVSTRSGRIRSRLVRGNPLVPATKAQQAAIARLRAQQKAGLDRSRAALQLEHAVHSLPAQSVGDLLRRQSGARSPSIAAITSS